MSEKQSSRRLGLPVILGGIAAVAIAVALIYGTDEGDQAIAACVAANDRLAKLEPHARGDMAAFTVPTQSQLLPDVTFTDGDGAPRKLSEWRGRTVLLNLWATWCAPCRREMPALDRLEATMGSDKFEVVAVSIDIGDQDKPRAFLEEIGATQLRFYADPSTDIFKKFKAVGRAPGMPTTLLIDEAGCELGFLAGPAEWDSPDVLELIRAAMEG